MKPSPVSAMALDSEVGSPFSLSYSTAEKPSLWSMGSTAESRFRPPEAFTAFPKAMPEPAAPAAPAAVASKTASIRQTSACKALNFPFVFLIPGTPLYLHDPFGNEGGIPSLIASF